MVKVDHVDRDTFTQKNYFFSYRRSTKLNEKDFVLMSSMKQ